MRTPSRLSILVLPLALLTTTTQPGGAQDVRYETVTRVELAGAAGTAMRLAARLGGGSMETVETTYISGRRMRSDQDRQSTILDLEDGRMTYLDHESRTYWSYTFEEMLEAMRRGAADVAATGDAARRETGDADAEVHLDFRISVDAAGRERIGGYNADRFFVTMAAEGQAAPEPGHAMEQAGTFVVLTEILSSTDAPAFAATRAFTDASAGDIAASASALMDGIAAALADDPRMKVAFEQAASEAQKIDGMAMRTVTRFVTVPPGLEFDRQAAVEVQSGGGVAAAAGRAALGGLRARAAAAAGRQQAEPEPGETLRQATILTVTSEVRNMTTTRVDPGIFEIPAGYRQVSMDGTN
jgi:hypothetical protein